MIRPVAQGRKLALERRQASGQEVAEGLAARVDVAAVAGDEIHGHVERVIDVALEAEAVLEHEGQDAAAVRIGVGPDMAAVAQTCACPAADKRRVGEQRRHHRLQRQADPELLHHVRLRSEVQVDLHRAGPEHHVVAELALLRHVGAHDPVALLRHPGHVLAPPSGIEAEAEKADAQLSRHLPDLAQMLSNLPTGLVQGLNLVARELDLTARLQGDGAAALGERNEIAVLEHRLPVESRESFEHGPDAHRPVIGERPQIVEPVGELLVLGADPPSLRRLAALDHVLDKLTLVGDGVTVGWGGR